MLSKLFVFSLWCLGSLAYAAAPSITYFSPSSGPVGTVVTVMGSNLAVAPTVDVNGASATVNVTQITLTIAPGTITGPISVTTPEGMATSASKFTVLNIIPLPPAITTFTPSSGVYFTVVTITGSNFSYASSVQFNGTAASSFILVNSTTISAKLQSGTTSGPISVTTPGGTAISATNFTISQPPTLTSFTPSSGFIGATVTLSGTNLTNASALQFNGTAATFTVVNAATISATVPAGANSGPITVTTPDGTETSAVSFTVLPPPTITAFTPSSGALYTVITITGTSFYNVSSVQFNGTASIFILVNSTTITAKVQAGTTSGPISVTTPGGTVSSVASFAVIPPSPTITSFTPSNGSAGTVVTLTGTNFIWTTAVAFGGMPAASFTIVSATSLTATVRSGTTSGNITVTNVSVTATSAKSFTVNNNVAGTPGTNPTDNAALVWVPGGSFTMGTPYNCWWNAPFTQQVTLTGYWIYKYQVTVAQYLAFCAATGHALPPWPDSSDSWSNYSDWTAPSLQLRPIVNVTWYDCAA